MSGGALERLRAAGPAPDIAIVAGSGLAIVAVVPAIIAIAVLALAWALGPRGRAV